MWKAIRLHPWRLEIVPAAAFALTVTRATCIRLVAWVVRRIPELRHSGLGILPWFVLSIVVASWFAEFGHNQSWVRSERRKRFNAYGLVMQCGIITNAWLAYALTSVLLAVTRRTHGLPSRYGCYS